MKITKGIMTEDYERWWRDAGQFLPPCDRMSGEQLDPFKQFGWEMWQIDEPVDDLKKDIVTILDTSTTNEDIVEKITELVES